MPKDKLPPIPSLPPVPSGPPEPRTPKRPKKKSPKAGAFRHLRGASKDEKLQDFARTGFAGYRRVVVAEKSRTPRLLLVLLGLAALTLVAFNVYLWSGPTEIEGTAAGPSSESDSQLASTRIDPELWRGDLEAIESFLFATPSDLGPMDELGLRFRDEAGLFAEHLRADGGAKELALADALDELAVGVARSDFNVRRLKALRSSWLETRRQRIQAADWLQSDLGEVNQTAELDAYRDAVEQIQDLLSQTLATGEDLLETGMSSAERKEEWRRTLFYYRDDLKVLRAGMPRRPDLAAAPGQLEVIRRFDRLFLAAQDLADDSEDLSRLSPAAFETAMDNANEAAAFLDRRLAE
ncbi:MAG: hypothetical protein AAGF23_11375 [Acidobacteriota bacterium]